MQSYSLRCLGVGDGWPCADRHHSAFLYEFPDACVLVDTGEPVCDRLKALRVDFNRIDRVVLSHMHGDHMGGLFMLLQGFWLEGRRKRLRVHLPVKGIEPVRRLLQAGCLFEELFSFKLELVPLRAGGRFRIGQTQITAIPNNHLLTLRQQFGRRYPEASFDAYSFLIETGGYRIGHSADIGADADLEPLLRQPLDLLVCEVAHSRPQDLFRYLQGRRIKQIVFVHLAGPLWSNRARTRQQAARILPRGNFHFARNGEVFHLA